MIGATTTLEVGDSAAATLLINEGAVVSDQGAASVAGQAGGGGASVEVFGALSRFVVNGLLDVGGAGSGALSLSGGATVTAGTLDAGNVAAAVARSSVPAPGRTWR